jgi:hypothetical protein
MFINKFKPFKSFITTSAIYLVLTQSTNAVGLEYNAVDVESEFTSEDYRRVANRFNIISRRYGGVIVNQAVDKIPIDTIMHISAQENVEVKKTASAFTQMLGLDSIPKIAAINNYEIYEDFLDILSRPRADVDFIDILSSPLPGADEIQELYRVETLAQAFERRKILRQEEERGEIQAQAREKQERKAKEIEEQMEVNRQMIIILQNEEDNNLAELRQAQESNESEEVLRQRREALSRVQEDRNRWKNLMQQQAYLKLEELKQAQAANESEEALRQRREDLGMTQEQIQRESLDNLMREDERRQAEAARRQQAEATQRQQAEAAAEAERQEALRQEALRQEAEAAAALEAEEARRYQALKAQTIHRITSRENTENLTLEEKLMALKIAKYINASPLSRALKVSKDMEEMNARFTEEETYDALNDEQITKKPGYYQALLFSASLQQLPAEQREAAIKAILKQASEHRSAEKDVMMSVEAN